ncbi:MAG: trimethylamine methyltransferase family protein [Lachnospiraceae bacterium]|nr:trimethylamine methyltransferase family protein [Lachnospiraceae bacterium]
MKKRVKYSVMTEAETSLFADRMEQLLSERGVWMDHEKMKEELAAAGCIVEGDRVLFPREVIKKAVASVPAEFTLYAPDEANNMVFPHPEGSFYTRTCTGAPFYQPAEGEKRLATLDDCSEYFALANQLSNISYVALPSACDPSVPENSIDVHTLERALTTSKKHIWIQPYEADNVKYLIEMCQAAAGGAEALREKPMVSFISCSVPVLQYKYMDAEIIYQCAKAGIPVQPCSLPTAGANAPGSAQGVALVACAEVLAQIVMLELLCPGLPVIAATLLFSLDMVTTQTLQSNTEITYGRLICMQVFEQYYNIRCHSYGTGSDSNKFDGQNMIERTSLIQAMALSDASVLGGAGQFDTAKTISPLQLIIDNEIFETAKRLRRGLIVDDDTMNFQELLSGNDAGGYLRSKHTRKFCRTMHRNPLFVAGDGDGPEEAGMDLMDRTLLKFREYKEKEILCNISPEKAAQLHEIVQRATKALAGQTEQSDS